MTDIREMTDVRELDPIELAEVVGGGDGFCGTVVPVHPWWPPQPPPPVPWWSV